MPELPEVETVVRDLRPWVVGRTIVALQRSPHKLRQTWNPLWNQSLLGRRFESIRRRGKWILLDLEDNSLLVVHLGMTGQWTITPREEPLENHTHVVFKLDNPTHELRYRDIRRFGSITYHSDQGSWEQSLEDRLGPEPFDLEPQAWYLSLKKSSRNLKALLLDQSIVAGVGNIYADESLFRAGLKPDRTGSSLTRPQAEKLRQAIVSILETAIASRGSTIRNYVGGSGLRGGYQDAHHVYGRTDQPCHTCGTPILGTRLAGRSTHYCPKCQK